MAKWLDTAVFYEIYPQSFQDTNADGIGDFQGIIRRLDYIKELGCDAIWINPCFKSPFGDAGYDVADYYTVAPRYGTNEDLKQLFQEAHARDMHVLLDLVPGHTSTEHPWFKESMKVEKNEYTDRYIWTDNIWEAPDDMASLRGISARDGSCALNFFSCQPALNYGFYERTRPWQQAPGDPGPQATLAEMKNIMRFWLGLGCDGFRVDMAHSLVKNDPESKGTIALWQDVRAFLDREFPEAVLVSEWGEPDKSLRGGFHMDFLLHFGPSHYNDLFRCEEPFFSSRGKGDASAFVKKYLENRRKAGEDGMICIPSGNHDMDRLARSLHGDELKIAFAFLLSMPGAPFVYYGDEIGMRYVEGLASVEGGYNRTGSRSPMQWDGTPNAGFSAAAPEQLYIPQDPGADRPTAEEQMSREGSLWREVQKLISVRRKNPALGNKGSIRFVRAEENGYPLAYIRESGEQSILVILNPGREEAELPMEAAGQIRESVYRFGGEVKADRERNRYLVPGQSTGFYLL